MTYFPKEAGTNLLHNGAMQVHQRGTSSTGITTGNWYTADRWHLFLSSMGTWTNTIESDAPNGSGLAKSNKILCTTADASPATADYVILRQRLEGQDVQILKKGTASAESTTLSFWTKSNTTGTYIVELYDHDNTRCVSAAYTVSSSGTWEYQSITFPGDATGAFDNDSEASLAVQFWLGSGTTYTSGTLSTVWAATAANRAVGQTNLAAATNNYWQVTGVQLEVGTTATEYQFKSYGQELLECQRYYQLGKAAGTTSINTDNGVCSARFPVQMRDTPIVTISLLEQIPGWGNVPSYAATASKDNLGFAHVKPNTANSLPSAFWLTYTATSDI